MQVSEENQKDGSKLRCEGERKGHTGRLTSTSFTATANPEENPEGSQGYPPGVLTMVQYRNLQAEPSRGEKAGATYSRHEGASKREPESPVGPGGS